MLAVLWTLLALDAFCWFEGEEHAQPEAAACHCLVHCSQCSVVGLSVVTAESAADSRSEAVSVLDRLVFPLFADEIFNPPRA